MSLLPFALLLAAQATEPAELSIRVDRPRVTVSKSLYGIFFEEINHAGDGGLYAELLNNRGFEAGRTGETPPGWRTVQGKAVLSDKVPFNDTRPRSLVVDGEVANEGFWGVPFAKGKSYRLVVWAKGPSSLTARLKSKDAELGQPTTLALGDGWKRYEVTLKPITDATDGSLSLASMGGPALVGWASLMPLDSWKGHGLRKDLAEKIAEIKPAFVRFPGGCFVEGQDFGRAFDWKKSIGAPETRSGKDWRFWGYPSTDGLGYHEYLQWCEDLGAEALFVANCGISHSEIAPMDKMGRWVQDALDAIEYANGPVTSKWGAERAKNGHPKPFNLKYVEIGNENGASWSFGGPAPYAERYKLMYDAIKKTHPGIVTIADNPVPHSMEVIDEHYYSNPAFFWQNKDKYDRYDRKGPRIYVGEYAVTQDCGRGNLKAALGEAAFITGMERNSDVVTMASYAPLFENIHSRQWNPNAIIFDNSRSYGTPAYWVQRLFGQNRPDVVVSSSLAYQLVPQPIRGGVALQTWKTSAEFKDIRLDVDGKTVLDEIKEADWRKGRGEWSVMDGVIKQTSSDQDTRFTLDGPKINGSRFSLSLKARKVSGEEGFIVMFGVGSGEAMQWNLGGWGNVRHAFQRGSERINDGVQGQIETGRWYDVRIEGDGPKIRAYLDGQLVQEVENQATPNLASVAGIDKARREIVVKLVNGAETDRGVKIALNGARVEGTAFATVLTSGSLEDENSLDQPLKVAPKQQTVQGVRDGFTYRLPARSLVILRVKLRG